MRFRRRVALATPAGPDRQTGSLASRLASQGPGMALALGRGAELGVLCGVPVRSQSQAASRQVPHWQLGQCGHGPRQPAPVRGARQIPQDPQLLPT